MQLRVKTAYSWEEIQIFFSPDTAAQLWVLAANSFCRIPTTNDQDGALLLQAQGSVVIGDGLHGEERVMTLASFPPTSVRKHDGRETLRKCIRYVCA